MNHRPPHSDLHFQRGGIISKLISFLFLLVLLFVLYLFRAPILRSAGEFWVIDEAPQHADAIVILGDDTFFAERAGRAAQLYHAGWAPRVVASGRLLRPYAGIAELMERDLTERGVPVSAIIRLPHRAANTLEEARAIRDLLDRNGWRRILLVTSNAHTRRSRYIFRRILPASFQLTLVAADDSNFNPRTWWRSRPGIKIFFYEAVGFPVAMWELRNTDPPPAALFHPLPAW